MYKKEQTQLDTILTHMDAELAFKVSKLELGLNKIKKQLLK